MVVVGDDGAAAAAACGTCTEKGFWKTGVNHMKSLWRNPRNRLPNVSVTRLTLQNYKNFSKLFLQLKSS